MTYLGGALAILAPFVLDFRDEDPGLSALYIAVGAVVVILSLVTNYSWGPDEQFASLDSNRSMAHS